MDDLLAKLDDPNEWVIQPGVPVFKAHEKTFADGTVRSVTEDELQEWLAQSEEMERQTKVCGLFRLGHIRTDLPDADPAQPPTAGVYRNPRLADVPGFGKRLVMDEWRSKKYADSVPEYPWRSVEIYRAKKKITAVAALKRDPQLHDLGPPNLYERTGKDGLELYALGGAMDTDKDAKTPTTSDPMSQLVPLLQQLLQQIQAGGGSPAGAEGMSKDGKVELFALQTENAALKAQQAKQDREVAEVKRLIAEEKSKAVLGQLALEHYSFDAAAELALMTAADDAGRAARAAAIRAHHAKLPPESLIELFQGPAEGATRPTKTSLTREEMNKIQGHCQATGKSFATARQEFLDGTLKI